MSKKRKSLLKYFNTMLYISLIAILFFNANEVNAAQKVNVKKVTVTALSGSKKRVVVAKGKKVRLTTNVSAISDKKQNRNVTYKSKNSKVASVNKTGVVKGVKAGSTKIVVTSKKNKSKKVTINVKVVKNPIKSIILNKNTETLVEGNKTKLTVSKYLPNKKVYKYVKWSSNNPSVATVNNKGEVIAHKEGTAVIKATAIDGSGKKASCKITVNKKTEVTNTGNETQTAGYTENATQKETQTIVDTETETEQIVNLLSSEYNNEISEIEVKFDGEVTLTKDMISINCVYDGEEKAGFVDFPINNVYTEDNETYHLYLANENIGSLIDDMKLNIHISNINGVSKKEISVQNNNSFVDEGAEGKALENVNIRLFTKDKENLNNKFALELFDYESGKKIETDSVSKNEDGTFICNIPYGKYIAKIIYNGKIYNHHIVTIEDKEIDIYTDFVNVRFAENPYYTYENYYDEFNNSQDVCEYYLPGTYTVLKKAISENGEVMIAKYNFTVESVAVVCTPLYEEYKYEEKGALQAETIVENEFKKVFIESGDGVYFKFVAPKDGIYTFSGIGCINTLGRIYDQSNILLAENLNDGIGQNFSVSYEMKSGKIYYIEARVEENNLTTSFVITVQP